MRGRSGHTATRARNAKEETGGKVMGFEKLERKIVCKQYSVLMRSGLNCFKVMKFLRNISCKSPVFLVKGICV